MSERTILVSSSTDEKACPYVTALRSAGVPVESIRVVKPSSLAPLREGIDRATGLVLCGGIDVAPERYGETIRPDAEVEVAPERDALEWSLLDFAQARRLPVWGVCRGFQLLNVMGQAEAEDLNLDGGPLYDPQVNYNRYAHSWSDWDDGPRIVPVSTRTAPPGSNSPVTEPPVTAPQQ